MSTKIVAQVTCFYFTWIFFLLLLIFPVAHFRLVGQHQNAHELLPQFFFFSFLKSSVGLKQNKTKNNITNFNEMVGLVQQQQQQKKWSFSEGYSRSNAAAATSVCNHLPAIVCVITTIPYHPHFAVHFARPHPPLYKNSIFLFLFCFVWRRKKEKC